MNSIEITKLRNAEYLQYMKDYAAVINLNNPSQLDIDTKISLFSTKITDLEALYKKSLASEKTQELLLLDERRDNAYNGIYIRKILRLHYFNGNLIDIGLF